MGVCGVSDGQVFPVPDDWAGKAHIDAAGYEAGAAAAAACMRRFRSYDPVSRTYIGRDRQRHPCP